MMTNDRKKDRQEIRNVNQGTELMYDVLKARWLALSQVVSHPASIAKTKMTTKTERHLQNK